MWDELDALASQLRSGLDAAAFITAGTLIVDGTHSLNAVLFARITLADVDQLHWEESSGLSRHSISDRQRGLIADMERLLAFVGASDRLGRLSDDVTEFQSHDRRLP